MHSYESRARSIPVSATTQTSGSPDFNLLYVGGQLWHLMTGKRLTGSFCLYLSRDNICLWRWRGNRNHRGAVEYDFERNGSSTPLVR
jgi:hypothetical protein